MTAPAELDRRIADARTAAHAGDWALVRVRLDGVAGVEQNVEGIVLLAESLLRTAVAGRARVWLEDALPVVEQVGDRAAYRKCLNMLGAACKELGDLEAAEHAWNRVIDLAHVDDDALVLARATNNLGIVANIRGEHQAALGLYQLAIPTYQRLGHAAGLAESYHNMAISYRDQADYSRADDYEQRAIEHALAARNPWLAAAARFGRADINLRLGDAELAGTVAHRVAEEWEALDDPVSAGHAVRLRGLALLATGRVNDARDAIERALAVAVEHANTLLEAECHRARAELCFAEADSLGATADITRAIALFDQLGARNDTAAAQEWAAERGLSPNP